MVKESITFKEYSILMNRIAYWLINNNKKFKHRDLYGSFGRVATYDTIVTAIKQRGTNYQPDDLISEFTECAIYDNNDLSFLPNYVTGSNGVKYYLKTYVDMANRVSNFEGLNGKHPAIVYIEGVNNSNITSTNIDATLQKVYNAFGKFDTFTGFLSKIAGRGYSYYYNDKYNTDTTISRIKNKQGVNCTDSCQLAYRVAIALGYEAQIIHVRCSGGDGHVRMRVKHSKYTNGSWEYYDPAAVLKSGSVYSQWCTSRYTLLAYNPAWIFNSMYN